MAFATRLVEEWVSTFRVVDERRLMQVVARQHGALSEAQARAAGMSRQSISRRVASGRFIRARDRVLVDAGAPRTWLRDLWAVQLSLDDAVVSHRSAAALWELEGIPRGTLEITARRKVAAEGVIVHRKRLDEEHVVRRFGLRVTTVERTLLDLGDVHRPRVVERALDDALHRGLTSMTRLGKVLDEAGGRGVRGSAAMRVLVATRAASDIRSQTTLERRLGRIIRAAGLPPPVPQHETFDEDGFVARVDFAYPDARLAIEADGYRFHRDRQAWASDLARRTALARAGWRVLHFTWHDVHQRPGWVVAEIRRSLVGSARYAGAGDQKS